MTNKEAIDLLLKSQIFLARNCGKADMYNAVELAIKALDQIELIKFNIHALRELMKEAENETN